MTKQIPKRIAARFSMNGQIAVIPNFHGPESNKEVDPVNYTEEIWHKYLFMVAQKQSNYYGSTDQYLYKALEAYPIKGKRVVVFGSVKPWYEAICFAYGCKSCTVLEHNVPEFDVIPGLEYKHIKEVEGVFDVGFSISSFEHSGLGRYGDPIDPNGDLRSMRHAQRLIVKEGLLFLAVPVSPVELDVVEWNSMRIYGKLRLPLMFKGWRLKRQFGKKHKPTPKDKKPAWYQPIFVLKNKRGKREI